MTDADLVLGFVPADFFLGGEIVLDRDAAMTAIGRVADPLGIGVEQAAHAIRTTVDSYMADQITEVATRRGHDVRDLTLVAGGGAGPVHAAFIADLLHIPQVVIPPIAASYSAFGMFAMDVGRNHARSYISRASELDVARVDGLYREMEAEALAGSTALGVDPAAIAFARTADLRYVGQFHEVEVAVPMGSLTDADVAGVIAGFHEQHRRLYTFDMPWQQVELLTFRVRATTPRAPFALPTIEAGGPDASAALKRRRAVTWQEGLVDTPVYDGALLRAGNEFHGPALIEELTTTVVVPPSYALRVDEYRNHVMTRDGTQPTEGMAEPAEATMVGGAA